MKIIDNFLTIKEQNLIHGIILSKEFGWRFKPYTTDESDFVSIKKNKHNLKIKDSGLFYHIFSLSKNLSQFIFLSSTNKSYIGLPNLRS